MASKIGTILPPKLPSTIPAHSQWLSGQGAGTWFCIDKTNEQDLYNIKRFNPTGVLECDRIFEIEKNSSAFDITQPYQFTHISHCAKCRIKQQNKVFVFHYLPNETQ